MAKRFEMNRKQFLFIFLITLVVFCGDSYSYVSTGNYIELYKGVEYPSDKELQALAVKTGMIPPDPDSDYVSKEIGNKNTITIWLAVDREQKIGLINGLIGTYKDKSGVVIRKPASYYVNEINGVLWNSFENGDLNEMDVKGLGNIFKTIAVIDGDYDNGKDKVQLFKDYIGEDWLKKYKAEYPDRYKELILIRQKTIENLTGKEAKKYKRRSSNN